MTIFGLDFEQLLSDPTKFSALQGMKPGADFATARKALEGVPGVILPRDADRHDRVPLSDGACAARVSGVSRVATAAVPAAHVTPPGLSYIARSTTIGAGDGAEALDQDR